MTGVATAAERRSQILLHDYRASLGVTHELIEYGAAISFDQNVLAARRVFPLSPEAYVSVWREYAELADQSNAFAVLQERFPQLNFPIQAGISTTAEYHRATHRGDFDAAGAGLALAAPEAIRLSVRETIAGPMPIIHPAVRRDFVALVQAFTKRNEPADVPDSMGASFVVNYNNWDRVARLKAQWALSQASGTARLSWPDEFRQFIAPNPSLYQDAFVIVSDGPYSGVPAQDFGLRKPRWHALSLQIRLEHEAAHYLTRRVYGAMHTHLLDELLADYHALIASTGVFRADWFLRFMGLPQAKRDTRRGGRMQNYVPAGTLSTEAWSVLEQIMINAANNLERFYTNTDARRTDTEQRAVTILAMASFSLEELSADAAPEQLARQIQLIEQIQAMEN